MTCRLCNLFLIQKIFHSSHVKGSRSSPVSVLNVILYHIPVSLPGMAKFRHNWFEIIIENLDVLFLLMQKKLPDLTVRFSNEIIYVTILDDVYQLTQNVNRYYEEFSVMYQKGFKFSVTFQRSCT